MADTKENLQRVAIALGSNVGDRLAALRSALDGLSSFLSITDVSPAYETVAEYVTDQPSFINAVVLAETKLAPLTLLWSVKQLENELGRLPTYRFGPRIIDIDILFYDNETIVSPELILPHPRMMEREFVLRPLADIAPLWKHPRTGLTVVDMLNAVPTMNPIRLYDDLRNAA